MIRRNIVNFGGVRYAFVSLTYRGMIATVSRRLRKLPTERTWKQLERLLTFDAPEAQ